MSKLFAGLLIAVLTLAGIYAIAAMIADNTTGSFRTEETRRHAGIVEFGSALRRASEVHGLARAKCELVAGAEKNICNAEAKSEQRRARTEARVNYKGNSTVSATPVKNIADEVRNGGNVLDIALYRAHRQLRDEQSGCFGSSEANRSIQKPASRLAMR